MEFFLDQIKIPTTTHQEIAHWIERNATQSKINIQSLGVSFETRLYFKK